MKSLRSESSLMMMALIDGSHSTSIPETGQDEFIGIDSEYFVPLIARGIVVVLWSVPG